MVNNRVLCQDARGSDDQVIRSVVEGLDSLMEFARRLIPPALEPRFDSLDLMQECFLRTQSRLDEVAALDSREVIDWLRRRLRQIAHDQWRSLAREKERLLEWSRSGGHIQPASHAIYAETNCMRIALRGRSRSDALLLVLV